MKRIRINLKIITILVICLYSCERASLDTEYITKNVIIIVIDGPRYSETWGDSSFSNIPQMKNISESGVLFTNFYNNGATNTIPGYASITTGNNQEISDLGIGTPKFPSIFQYWNKKYSKSYPVSRIFASKDKLAVLSDCIDTSFKGYYRPYIVCGVNGTGVGSGFRNYSITLRRTLNALRTEHPRLLLLSFREPDFSAHQNNWMAYIDGIKNTDNSVYQIWDFIEKDNYYKGKTEVFITNDHGRHLDNVNDGFVSHGDTCDRCRHISLLVLGPDFKRGDVITNSKELIDIPATIAEILRFPMPTRHRKILSELFN
jgi:predicted AlkP superfamily pyrophosphatase or phosphodiesterase